MYGFIYCFCFLITIQTLCLLLFQRILFFPFLDPRPCGKPPGLENGDLREGLLFEYQHGERVAYVCQNLYTLQGSSHKTCRNGEWTGTMRCLGKCQQTEILKLVACFVAPSIFKLKSSALSGLLMLIFFFLQNLASLMLLTWNNATLV